MIVQDYIMRQISEMIRVLLKLLFGVDVEEPSIDLLKEGEERRLLRELFDRIDEGAIGEAENRIAERTESGSREDLETALIFYSYLNLKSDGFLEQNGFDREKIRSGLLRLAGRYGLEDMTDLLLQ